MKREIKFRGHIIDTEEWIYGDFTTSYTVRNGIKNHRSLIGNDDEFCDIEYHTAGQFTGEKDLCGKDIYEWDVVKCSYRGQSIYGAIVYERACFFIVFTNGQKAWLGEAVNKYRVEVIGDVFNNDVGIS